MALTPGAKKFFTVAILAAVFGGGYFLYEKKHPAASLVTPPPLAAEAPAAPAAPAAVAQPVADPAVQAVIEDKPVKKHVAHAAVHVKKKAHSSVSHGTGYTGGHTEPVVHHAPAGPSDEQALKELTKGGL